MNKLPATTPKKIIKALQKLGFWIDRQKGGHITLVNNGYTITVPFHNEDLPRGTLKGIIKQSGIKGDKLENFLKNL